MTTIALSQALLAGCFACSAVLEVAPPCERAVFSSRSGLTHCRVQRVSDASVAGITHQLVVEVTDCDSGETRAAFRKRFPYYPDVLTVSDVDSRVVVRQRLIESAEDVNAVTIVGPSYANRSLSVRDMCGDRADDCFSRTHLGGLMLLEHAYVAGSELKLIFGDRLTVVVDIKSGRIMERH